MNSQRKKSTYFVTLFTILVTLLPSINYVTTGIEAVAATTSPATTLFENQYGSAKVSYEEDPDQKHLDWTIEYSKISSELARQIGFRINSANQMLVPEKITSDPSNLFALDTSNVDQSTILQTKATKEASQGKIFFQTAYITSLSIQALENEFQTDGTKNDLLADQESIVVSIPAKETQTTESKSSIANSVSTNTADQTTEVSSATVVENNPKKSKTENTTTTLSASSTSATSNSSATSETKTQETTADTKAAAKVERRVRVASAAASEETARDIITLPEADQLTSSSEGGKTILDSAKITKSDGSEISATTDTLKIGTDIRLTYNWSIPDDLAQEIKAGDYFQFKLPNNFKIQNTLTGDLSDGTTVYGKYTFNTDGTAKIIFTDEVAKHSSISGSLYVAGKVDNSNNDINNQIMVPFTGEDQSKLPPIIIPNRDALAKAVDKDNPATTKTIENDGANIVWTLEINRTNEIMPKDSYVTDTLPNKDFSFKQVLSVTAYDLDPNSGELKDAGTDATSDVKIDNNGEKITFNQDTRKYYEIKVLTHVDHISDYATLKDGNPNVEFINKATLTENKEDVDTAEASKTYANSSSLSKEGTQLKNGLIKWTVKVTHSDFDTPTGTVFKDVMTNGQNLTDKDGTEISEGTLATDDDALGLTIKNNKNGTYDFTTTAPITKDFTFTYYSKAPSNAIGDFNNKITWNKHTEDKTITGKNSGSGIVKGFAKDNNDNPEAVRDTKNKTQQWAITINSKKQTLSNWWIQDTLDEGLSMQASDIGSIRVYDEDQEVNKALYTITPDANGKGFKIEYKGAATNHIFRIKYTSHYDDTIRGKDLTNHAAYNYTFDGTNYEEDGSNKINFPKLEQPKMQGSKSGSLNKVNNTIDWTININSGNQTYGNDAKIIDPIPAGVTYQTDSLKILKDEVVDTSSTIKATYDETKKTVTFTGFKAGDTSNYQLTFTTKIDTEKKTVNGKKITIIPQGTVTNQATYSDDKNQAPELKASVQYNSTGDFIVKDGQVNNEKTSVNFTVKIDPDTDSNKENKLKLEAVHLQDTLSDTLQLKDGSIKLTYNDGSTVPAEFYTIKEGVRSIDLQFMQTINQQINLTYIADVLIPNNPGSQVNVNNKVVINGNNIQDNAADKSIEVDVPSSGGCAQGVVGSIILTKKTIAGEKISGASFDLYAVEKINGQTIEQLYTSGTTDIQGQINFTGLPYGTYIVKETQAAEGYYIGGNPEHKVTIGKSNKLKPEETLEVTNEKVGAITLTKVDSTDPSIKLAKATFELYQDGKKVTQNALGESIDTFTTNDQGVVSIPSLIPGDYVLKEVGAPEGYHVSTSDTTIAVKAGETTETTVKNTINQGAIELQKESADNKKLKGADFTLIDTTDASKKIVKTKTTDEHGLVDFELQANHTYKIKETKNPTGYEGSYELTGIKVTDEGKVVYTDQSGKKQTFTSSDTPIVVTNNRIVTTIKGTKTWKDADNTFGSRPNSVNVQLMQDGQVYATKNVTKADNWSYEFTDLPVIAEGGHRYNYTINETNVAANYQAETNGNNITNTLKTTSVSGEKTWNDNNNQYNLRPSSIKVQLLQDKTPMTGAEYTKEVKVDQNGKWDYTFTGLPKYDSEGHEYNYSVQEIEENKNYTSTVTGMDLTNKLATTKVSVDKTWNDQDNTYKTRPKNLTATLMVKQADGWKTFKEVFGSEKSLELNQANNWKGDFDNLPVYDKEQNQVQYGVKEELSTNIYTPNGANEGEQQVTIAAVAGISHLTNNLNTVAVTVNKTWKDFDNKFNIRPNEITFQLYAWTKDEADAEKFGTADRSSGEYTIKGNEQHQFSPLTISGLPKYDQNGNEMHYKVKEINIQKNYQATPNYSAKDNSLSIENILETTDVTINKQWDDQGNQAFERPEVTLQLFRQVAESDAEAMPGADYTKTIKAGSKADSWSYTFKNLPKKDSTGNVYSYSVKETSKDSNYQASQVDPLTVKNTLITKQVRVVKHWKDFDNKYNSRPDEIEFNLMYKQDGQERAFMDINQKAVTKSIKVVAGNDWSYTFDKLPAKDAQGNDYTYDVQEVLKKAGKVITPNYTSENLGTTMNNTLRVITVNGEKHWDDQDNKFNSRPTSIKVQLLQNGKAMSGDEYIQEVKVNEDGTWSYAFDKLPELDTNGEKYVYTVKELDVPKNYQATEAGMDVTNKLVTTSFAGDKVWDDQDDQDKIRPAKVTIVLLQNGTQIAQTETSAKEKWHYRFEKLAKYDRKGDRYDYTVKELNVPKGYQSSVEGHTIINRHTPTPPTSDTPKDHLPTTKGGTGKTDAKMYPQTNDKNQAIWMIIGVVIILLVIMIWSRKRKSE